MQPTTDKTSDIKSITIKGRLPNMNAGEVWLVGAGAGDPGLLTIHAINALQQADVVLYDELVDINLRAWSHSATIWRYVGKKQQLHSLPQTNISQLLVELAKQNKKIVRLKGGDPFIFARGGEEALALAIAGIKFRIIPGVSAATTAMAYAGIPATHREINHSVTFITGHSIDDGSSSLLASSLPASSLPTLPAINWQAIANASEVLVIYMGLKNIAHIAAKLLQAGRPGDEAVAIICSASFINQNVVHTTLSEMAEKAASLKPPALLVIGKITLIGKKLAWINDFADHIVKPTGLG